MKRTDFLEYLTRAVADEFLTESEAADLLRQFDAGTLSRSMLPLPLSEVITETTGEDAQRAIIVLVAMGILTNARKFPRLTEKRQEAIATRLQEKFSKDVQGLAASLIKSQKLPDWQLGMSQTIQEHIIQQALMGRLRPLLPSEINALDSVIKTQQAFASRFADEIASRALLGNPFSYEYLASRSEQYNGEARAVFYREKESEAEDGMVIDYVALDDDGTCDECLDAQNASPYLPSEGPMPSEVCRGRGFCRCVREARFDPAAAAELRSELRAA